MPVVNIGIVRVGMGQRLVNMAMRVRPGRVDSRLMRMPVMRVVRVPVAVLQAFMRVLVLVFFGKMQPDASAHEAGGDKKCRPDRLAQQKQCDHRAEKGSKGKIRAGARRADMPKREHEKGEAETVAQESNQQCAAYDRQGGQLCAKPKRDREVYRSGDRALNSRGLERVARGDLLRQVIVDPPAQAGSRNRQSTHRQTEPLCTLPGECSAADYDQQHTDCDAPVEVLLKDEPGKERGKDPFHVQQQRGGGGRSLFQAKHQQHRTADAAEEYGPCKPGQILAWKRRLVLLAAKEIEQRQSQPRAEIEKPGKQDRRRLAQ